MKPSAYLANPGIPVSLRAFLEAALANPKPAGPLPELYARTKRDFSGRSMDGTLVKLNAGERVRVTDVGQFGDVGITHVLDEAKAYQARSTLAELTEFSGRP
jgi:hypothetical protein